MKTGMHILSHQLISFVPKLGGIASSLKLLHICEKPQLEIWSIITLQHTIVCMKYIIPDYLVLFAQT